MLVTERSVARAINQFLFLAHLDPLNQGTVELVQLHLRHKVIPAFMKALEAIEEVHPCHGFSKDKVFDILWEGAAQC